MVSHRRFIGFGALATCCLFTNFAGAAHLQRNLAFGGGTSSHKKQPALSVGHGGFFSGLVFGFAICYSLGGVDEMMVFGRCGKRSKDVFLLFDLHKPPPKTLIQKRQACGEASAQRNFVGVFQLAAYGYAPCYGT